MLVAANPFRPRNKTNVFDLDLTKIIKEEEAHNHGANLSVAEESSELPDVNIFIKPERVIDNDDTISEMKDDSSGTEPSSPFIREPEKPKEIDSFGRLSFEPIEQDEVDEFDYKEDSPSQNQRPTLDSLNGVASAPPADSRIQSFRDTPKAPYSQNNHNQIITELPDNSQRKNESLPPAKRLKKWRWKNRWFLWALLFIVIAAVACFVADRNLNRVELNTSSSGLRITYNKDADGKELPEKLPVRVLSYSSDAKTNNDLLYYVDTTATINTDGTMNIAWDIPENYSNRGVYSELCILDETRLNEEISSRCNEFGVSTDSFGLALGSSSKFNHISCVYYVPPNTNGLISFITGKNQIGDNQKVGCSGDEDKNWSTSSYFHKSDIEDGSSSDNLDEKDSDDSTNGQSSSGGVINSNNINSPTTGLK